MLLRRLARHNVLLGAAVGACLAASSAAPADEIRRWRDANGQIHVEIVGDGKPVDPDAEGMPLLSTTALSPDEKFSFDASRRRRQIEKGLEAASAEIGRLEAEIGTIEQQEFVVYTPPTARSSAEAQFLLDAQRNAFLAAQRFRQEQEERLRKLRRDRRRELTEIAELWSGFEELRQEVRERYGEPPGWWRDQISCEGCLTAAQAAAALDPPDDPKDEDAAERRSSE